MGLNEYIQVGNRIKEIRKSKGLSQRDVATKLHMAFSTYSNYENNNREPNFETLKRIADVLDVSVAQLINDETVADEETSLFQMMTDYLDELGLSLDQDESDMEYDRFQIVSAEHGTIVTLGRFELQNLFESILKDADLRKDRYIINRLSVEFDISKKE